MSYGITHRRSSDKTMTSLSPTLLLKDFVDLIPLDVDIEQARQITLKGKKLNALPCNIGALLREVRRLDFSDNNIHDVTPLASLCNLTSVNISKNKTLSSIAPFISLHLTVCVVAHCNLRSLAGLEGSASTLKTLIANDNNLILQSPTFGVISGAKSEDVETAVANYNILGTLLACETVVFSRNPQLCALYAATAVDEETRVACDTKRHSAENTQHHEADWSHPLSVLEKMSRLKKLSLSECGLTSLPSHWFLPMVSEVRLSHNALQSLVPKGVIFRSVKILDVSHNKLVNVATLRRCRYVRRLGISGNPFLKEVETNLQKDNDEKVSKHVCLPSEVMSFLRQKMPYLEVVDGTSLSLIRVVGEKNGKVCEDKKNDEAKEQNEAEVVNVNQSSQPITGEELEDVVVTPPVAVVEATRAPIVRRERTNLLAQRKRELHADGAAVAQLVMKRRTETTPW